MSQRRLGRTGIEVSPIGLGCWQFSQGKGFTRSMWSVLDQETIESITRAALDGGITWFDSAQGYGNGQSERALGTALHDLKVQPGEVVIATKWLPILKTAANIPRTIDTRLACLQGYGIDLYQVHIPWSISPIRAQMREMAKLLRAGKIRAVGVSNFSARQMEAASRALKDEGTVLASNQVSISLLDRRIEGNGVLADARRLGVTLMAYSPLAQGLLTGKFHADPARLRAMPAGRRSRFSPASRAFRPENLARTAPLIDALRAVGTAHDVSAAQVALAWVTAFYGDTVVAIAGATRPAQAAESAAAMGLRLTAEELARLDAISACVARR
jgi:aryl-alcohol dehydrogenase-like predicted oxidoreductase